MAKLLIKNGRVIDPANNLDAVCDILVEAGKIAKVAKNIKSDAEEIIDATDKMVLPGLVDMHVHLREPGREDKETIASGTRAAAKGGVTSVLAMPNTLIPIDSLPNIELLKGIIEKSAQVNVFICGAISKGRLGKELTDISALKAAGAIALSDDGASVDDAGLMQEALRRAKEENIVVSCHCEDKSLSGNGVVNAGFTSTRLGLRGISAESEYQRVARDIELAEKADAPIHIAHVSSKESVALIAKAKARGVKVTAEATPHHFSLSEEAVLEYDTNMKVNPPLRSQEDIEAIKAGLKDGTIDAIASDHAPHTENEKDIEFERAEFGSIGLETILAVSISALIETKVLSWPELVKRLSLNPAQILKVAKGTLSPGQDADIIVVDPEQEWAAGKSSLVSKSKNCAFLGKVLKGVVEYTLCGGRVVYALYPDTGTGKID